jgi:hypothetical protein
VNYFLDAVSGDDTKSGLTWALRWQTYAHAGTVMVAGDTLTTINPATVTPVSQVAPLLSLEQWRQQIHYNPWHFFGWVGVKVPVTSQCNTVVKQYAWQQQNAVGRAEIMQAIVEAEKRLTDYLNYSPAPHFIQEEVKDYPRFYDKQFWARYPLDARGEWKPVTLKEGYVQGVGTESLVLINTTNVVYSDSTGYGLNDTFTLTVTTSVTDPSQLAVYFAAADRLNSEAAGERWRIQPVSVAIAGGVATIRGRAWLLGKPILFERYDAPDLDPSTASNFVSTLEVYQRTFDPNGQTTDTSQGKFIWETLPYPWWGTVGNSLTSGATDPASQAYALARVGVRDAKCGIVVPGEAIYDAASGTWNMTMPPWVAMQGRPPDRVLVRYYAGYPLENGQMASKFQTAVARLAMAQLDNRIAACDEANRELARWQRDRSTTADKTEEYRINSADLDCPWGTRLGAIDAWRQVKHLQLLRGVNNN